MPLPNYEATLLRLSVPMGLLFIRRIDFVFISVSVCPSDSTQKRINGCGILLNLALVRRDPSKKENLEINPGHILDLNPNLESDSDTEMWKKISAKVCTLEVHSSVGYFHVRNQSWIRLGLRET